MTQTNLKSLPRGAYVPAGVGRNSENKSISILYSILGINKCKERGIGRT